MGSNHKSTHNASTAFSEGSTTKANERSMVMDGIGRVKAFSVANVGGNGQFSPRTMKTDRSLALGTCIEGRQMPHFMTPTRNKTIYRKKTLKHKKKTGLSKTN